MRRILKSWDLAAFRTVAAREWPGYDGVLPRLSRSADHGRLWLGTAAGIVLSGVGGPRARRGALYGVASLAAASATVNTLWKWSVRRHRPTLDEVPAIRRLKRQPTSTSFPSGHAASAAAFVTGLASQAPAWGLALTPLAAAVGFSRVYTGVHYPGDVLAGAVIGTGTALAVSAALSSRMSSPPGQPPLAVPALPRGAGLVVVVNTGSGSAEAVREARRLLPDAEFVHWSAESGPLAAELARCARRAAEAGGALGVLGGDGTVSSAAPVALRHGVPLAVLPGGTFNHLARDLDITEPADAARAVHAGEAIAVELARFSPGPCAPEVEPGGPRPSADPGGPHPSAGPGPGRPTGSGADRSAEPGAACPAGPGHFVNTFSLGSYPELVRVRERWRGRIGPWAAGVVAAVVTLRTSRPVEATFNGRRRAVWLLFVGNCGYDRLGSSRARRPDLADGLLDVHVVHAGRWARARLVATALTGLPHRSPVHGRARVGRLRISDIAPGTLCAFDGETARAPSALLLDKDERLLPVYRPLPAWLNP